MGFFNRLKASQQPATPEGSTGLSLQFAVLDVETTGLNPVENRIIEIAVAIMQSDGTIIHEWTTLVNPGDGQVGSSDAVAVHGVQRDWLAAAPTFAQILGDLSECLVGRVVTAHNSRFDTDFIEAEYKRLGLRTGDYAALDTMDLASRLGLERKLAKLAQQLGVSYYSHSALEDARAAARCLAAMLRYVDPATFRTSTVLGAEVLPFAEPSRLVMHREKAAELTRPHDFLAELVGSLPSRPTDQMRDPAAAAAYLTVLERAMEDGYLSPEEQASLLSTARQWGLGSDDLDALHREFLDGLLDVAFADRRLTKQEREEVERAAIWLGVEVGDLDLLIRQARARSRAHLDEERAQMRGRCVAFTGKGIYSKSIREALCAKYGITFRSIVAADVELLVVGTEAVTNATVDKARSLGVPLTVESAFWTHLGERLPAPS